MNNETLNRLNAFIADYKKESEEKDAIIKKQNQTLLRISAELEATKQYDPFDLVLITGSIENISNIIEGQTELIIDEDCIGCAGPCMAVGVAADLQKELDSCRLVIKNFKILETRETDRLHKIIKEYKETLRLERIDHVTEKIAINRKYNEDRREKNATIEELKDRNFKDLHELYNFYEAELRSIKADRTSIKSDRDIMFQNYRNTVAKLQGDIKGLEAELSARKEDSAMLMKVVDIVKNWDGSTWRAFPTLIKILDELVEYTDAPEGQPETPIDENQEITVTVALLELP